MVYIHPTHERIDPINTLKKRQLDLSRHLSVEAKARLPNPIKAIWKAAQVKPGTINMGNGDPHHTLYPVCEMNFVVPSINESRPCASLESRHWRSADRCIIQRRTMCAEPAYCACLRCWRWPQARPGCPRRTNRSHSCASQAHRFTESRQC
ncbi:hypothetical protein EDD16DRAFT_804887 [Pisolithus croceorrhizus]|nr:hypothetical protein EDD16DRAFT_804887 [Pisolithus croceorrhizus]